MAGEAPRVIAAATSETEAVRIALFNAFTVTPGGFDRAPTRLTNALIKIIAFALLTSPRELYETKGAAPS
jgi:hypothetical protein